MIYLGIKIKNIIILIKDFWEGIQKTGGIKCKKLHI